MLCETLLGPLRKELNCQNGQYSKASYLIWLGHFADQGDETLALPNYHLILDALKVGDHLNFLYIDDALYSGSQLSQNLRMGGEYGKFLKAIEDKGVTADLEVIIHSYSESGLAYVKSSMKEVYRPIPFSEKNIRVNFHLRYRMKTMGEVITEFIKIKAEDQRRVSWQTIEEIYTVRGENRFEWYTAMPLMLKPHKIPDAMSFFQNLKKGLLMHHWKVNEVDLVTIDESQWIRFIPGDTLKTIYRNDAWISKFQEFLKSQKLN